MSIILAILVIGIIIIIHELGHFLLAKKNGITVTEFSVGMGPRIASFVKNGTRYSIKLLPIGGSCMMLGEDENVEDEGAFNKKGVWARFSVIFAGAFFNFILAFVLALVVIGTEGVDKPLINEIEKGSASEEAGLMAGDHITRINGSKINFGKELFYYFYFNPVTEKPIDITYIRNGVKDTVAVTPKEVYMLGFTYNNDSAKVLEIAENFPFAKAGIAVGDIITAINDIPISTGTELSDYIDEHPLKNDAVNITYSSNGDVNTVTVVPELAGYDIGLTYNLASEKVSPLSAIKYSFFELKFNIVNTVKTIGYLITGKIGMNQVAGPVGIVNMVDQIVTETKDYGIRVTLMELINFCILLSANLGVMNLLPFPALDGGRLIFLLIEAIRGKPVPKEREAMVHLIGMAALMVFMVFVLYNDIRNIFVGL